MPEGTEDGQNSAGNTSIICGSEMHMSELEETAREYGRKIAASASRAGEYVKEKAAVAGEKLRDLEGKDFGQIAGAGVADHYHVHIVPRWSGDSNFMTVTARTRLVPEELDVTFDKLQPHFNQIRRELFAS